MILVKLLDYFVDILEKFLQRLFALEIYLLFAFLEEIVERNYVCRFRFVLDLLEELERRRFR